MTAPIFINSSSINTTNTDNKMTCHLRYCSNQNRIRQRGGVCNSVFLLLLLLLFIGRSQQQTTGTVIVPQNTDCPFQSAEPMELDDGLYLNQVLDPMWNVVHIELIYEGMGWLGVAFSTEYRMVANIAIIGLPVMNKTTSIQHKYALVGQENSEYAVRPLPTLPEDSIVRQTTQTVQNETHTILRFTKPLSEPNEFTLSPTDEVFLLWAVGGKNKLSYHIRKGGIQLKFDQCVRHLDLRSSQVAMITPKAEQASLFEGLPAVQTYNVEGSDPSGYSDEATVEPTSGNSDATVEPTSELSVVTVQPTSEFSDATVEPTSDSSVVTVEPTKYLRGSDPPTSRSDPPSSSPISNIETDSPSKDGRKGDDNPGSSPKEKGGKGKGPAKNDPPEDKAEPAQPTADENEMLSDAPSAMAYSDAPSMSPSMMTSSASGEEEDPKGQSSDMSAAATINPSLQASLDATETMAPTSDESVTSPPKQAKEASKSKGNAAAAVAAAATTVPSSTMEPSQTVAPTVSKGGTSKTGGASKGSANQSKGATSTTAPTDPAKGSPSKGSPSKGATNQSKGGTSDAASTDAAAEESTSKGSPSKGSANQSKGTTSTTAPTDPTKEGGSPSKGGKQANEATDESTDTAAGGKNGPAKASKGAPAEDSGADASGGNQSTSGASDSKGSSGEKDNNEKADNEAATSGAKGGESGDTKNEGAKGSAQPTADSGAADTTASKNGGGGGGKSQASVDGAPRTRSGNKGLKNAGGKMMKKNSKNQQNRAKAASSSTSLGNDEIIYITKNGNTR